MAQHETLKLASINLLRDGNRLRPTDKAVAGVERDLRKVADRWHPAIIGTQEAKQYVGALRDGLLPGYRVALHKGARGDAKANAILYDPEQVRLRSVDFRRAHGGAAFQYPSRNIITGNFEWLADGSTLSHSNTHLNSKIDAGGRPSPFTKRVRLSTGHLHLLADEVVRSSRGRRLAFLGGDFNIDEDADNRVDFSGFPNSIFRAHGIESIYDELDTPASFDTHGSRKIDVIASVRRDGRVEAIKVRRIASSNLRTDHAAICAFYRVRLLGT